MKRTLRSFACAVAIATACSAIAAAPAHAKTHTSGRAHLMRSRTAADSVEAAKVNLTYHGGPVMRSGTRTVPIFWEPAKLQDGTSEAFGPGYTTLIQRFLKDIGGSGLYNNLTQYYEVVDGHERFIVNRSGLLQAVVDTNMYPAATGACSTNALVNCITDDQLQNEIASVITANSLPTDLSTMYLVFTAPMEASCADATNCFRADSFANFTYCAYHSFFPMAGQPVIYANMPYVASSLRSISGCAGTASHPNANVAFDDETSALSHEFNEAISDPITAPGHYAWYDAGTGDEVADICIQKTAQVTWHGHTYVVQKEWSNATGSCVPGGDDRISLGPASGPRGSATTVTGHGFRPHHLVTLVFTGARRTVAALGTATTSGAGRFSIPVSTPAGAAAGPGTVGATGANPGDGASAGFTVAGAGSFRPDARIGRTSAGPWTGNDVYDAAGVGQTLTLLAAPGRAVAFWVQIQNDGTTRDRYQVDASTGSAGFVVTCAVAGSPISGAVESGTFRRLLRPGGSFLIRVSIRVPAASPHGAVFHARVRARSLGRPEKRDAVVGSVRAA